LVEYSRCPTDEDAEKVFLAIQEQFHNGHNVILSFEGMDFILPPFLRFSIGPLLHEYPEEEVRARIQVINITEDDRLNVDRAIRDMVAYYKDPERHNRIFNECLEMF
jgi:hypothetical protein